MTSFDYRLNPIYAIKECSSCGSLYTSNCGCSKGSLEDKILVPKPPRNCVRCARCGTPVDGPYCQGCALLRKEFMEGLLTNCVENEFFKDFQDTSESSDDNTNVVNAPREPIVVNQDPGENSSPSPPHIDHCCHECGDSLDGIFCRQCTCKSCGKGAHYGYNCPPKVPIISNPEPCKNQTIDEPLQNLQSLQQQCLLGTCQRCGCNEYNGVCFYCKVGNGTPINVSTPYSSNDSPSVANHPPQPQYVPYSRELCGNDSHYSYDCPPQVHLLQTAEQGIKKIDVPSISAAPVLTVGHNAKKRKTSHSNWKGKAAKGKSDRGSKRKFESEIAPTGDPKEAVCFYCNTKGHWKRSCPKYLKDLKDGKVEKGGHSGMFMIELHNTTTSDSWVLDTGCGTHICTVLQGLKESRKLKHGELNLVMGNMKITPVTKIGKYELMLKSGVRIILNNSSPCKGIYETVECIDNGNVILNVGSSNELDKSKLWHSRLGHINKKRIAQLQKDGVLESFDFKSDDERVKELKDYWTLGHTAIFVGPFESAYNDRKTILRTDNQEKDEKQSQNDKTWTKPENGLEKLLVKTRPKQSQRSDKSKSKSTQQINSQNQSRN
ncbi:hypothetical protein Tco_1264586 [Tanacetum coccineum]